MENTNKWNVNFMWIFWNKEKQRKTIENAKKPTFSIVFLNKNYCKFCSLLLWLDRIKYIIEYYAKK